MYHSLVRHKHYSIRNNNLVGFFRFSFFSWILKKTKQNKNCTQKHNLTCLQVFEHWSATWIFKVNFALRKIVSGDATQPTDASYALWIKNILNFVQKLGFQDFFQGLNSEFNSWHKWHIHTNTTSSKSTVCFYFLIFSIWFFNFLVNTNLFNPNSTNTQFKKVGIPHLMRTMRLAISENIIAG